jgi:hypothetical protein
MFLAREDRATYGKMYLYWHTALSDGPRRGHGVRQPRAQAGEGPKPSIEPPRPYSPLDINKLMRREAENG